MDLKQTIINLANKKTSFKTGDVIEKTGNSFSRQYVSKVIKSLIKDGILIKNGNTKQSVYARAENAIWLAPKVSLEVKNVNLEEDRILRQVKLKLRGITSIPDELQKIFDYAFSEMLNNAIEHSRSSGIGITANLDTENVSFSIKDGGIGAFANIVAHRNLANELEAIQDLLKGKTTTAMQKHSGEGIFFTSKVADLFILRSHKLELRIDNLLPDVFVQELENSLPGTEVYFKTSLNTNKTLNQIFSEYQIRPDSFEFDKTSVLVRLYTLDTNYVSRSQARRILVGLSSFKEIVLDFDRVKTVGQGFTDEIFRVFTSNNPEINIVYKNANKIVESMIKHVGSI